MHTTRAQAANPGAPQGTTALGDRETELHRAGQKIWKLPRSLDRHWYPEFTLLEATGAKHGFCYPFLRMWRLLGEEVLESWAPNGLLTV